MRPDHLRYSLLSAREHGVITILPEESYIDEVIGWSVAVLGIWSQLASGVHA